MRIEPRVGMRLTCHIRRDYHVTAVVHTSWTDYYGVQTAWVDRPAEGIRSGQLRCVTCGQLVGFRIYSETGARARKRRWLAAALIAAVSVPLVIWAASQYQGAAVVSWLGGLVPGLGIGALASMSILSFCMLPTEDGVVRANWSLSFKYWFKPPGLWSRPAPNDQPSSPEITFDN